jgi:uncharacterized protein (TIGR02145 family)
MKYFPRFKAMVLISIGLIPGFQYCKKASVPIVETANAWSISITSAYSGGNVLDDGGGEVTSFGVCWSTSQNPTIASSKTNDGQGKYAFYSFLTGLVPNTTYYVRAYAVNGTGPGYGQQIQFITKVDITGETVTINDIDGNSYQTIGIGGQRWMAENLRTTKLNDGTAISLAVDNDVWGNLGKPGYCWYDNDSSTYAVTYGAIYNGYAAQTVKLCPTGWHVPNGDDWVILINYAGGENVTGDKLKETGLSHWVYANEGTNDYGFTALPGGWRLASKFEYLGSRGSWWSSSIDNEAINSQWMVWIRYEQASIYMFSIDMGDGLSLRCLQDN